MKVFRNDNDKRVFVLAKAIDIHLIAPESVELARDDINKFHDELFSVAAASAALRKMQPEEMDGEFLPGDEILWIEDESLTPEQRVMVVMDKVSNNHGGFGYDALNMTQFQKMRAEHTEMMKSDSDARANLLERVLEAASKKVTTLH